MKKSKLDIFWNITSKWYFFPLLYLSLVVTLILSEPRNFEFMFFIMYLMPNGIFYFVNLLSGYQIENESMVFIFPLIYFLLIIISISIIQYYKFKRKIILKWLILSILLLILLTFSGCIATLITGSDFINFEISVP